MTSLPNPVSGTPDAPAAPTAAQDWRCEKCGYQGVVNFAPADGVYEVRDRIEDAHARCSGSCAKENGLFFVTVSLAEVARG